ncbi:MAG TPA: DUF389 domain-containing protein [Streptosporangiaceae bacterium]|nr:DUF389 domain-containing protein [Streptosporangiaceae bacterium]
MICAEARANALIGVFISVATIPAATSAAGMAAYSSWGEAGPSRAITSSG